MGTIKINSTTGAKIFIDNVASGTINKQSKTFNVSNGHHQIYAKAAWCSSQPLTVNVTDQKTTIVTLNSFKHETLFKAAFMLLAGLLLFTKNMIFAVFAAIVFLYPLYYLTFGKNNYLQLSEKTIT